jgi:hypothetical protein
VRCAPPPDLLAPAFCCTITTGWGVFFFAPAALRGGACVRAVTDVYPFPSPVLTRALAACPGWSTVQRAGSCHTHGKRILSSIEAERSEACGGHGHVMVFPTPTHLGTPRSAVGVRTQHAAAVPEPGLLQPQDVLEVPIVRTRPLQASRGPRQAQRSGRHSRRLRRSSTMQSQLHSRPCGRHTTIRAPAGRQPARIKAASAAAVQPGEVSRSCACQCTNPGPSVRAIALGAAGPARPSPMQIAACTRPRRLPPPLPPPAALHIRGAARANAHTTVARHPVGRAAAARDMDAPHPGAHHAAQRERQRHTPPGSGMVPRLDEVPTARGQQRVLAGQVQPLLHGNPRCLVGAVVGAGSRPGAVDCQPSSQLSALIRGSRQPSLATAAASSSWGSRRKSVLCASPGRRPRQAGSLVQACSSHAPLTPPPPPRACTRGTAGVEVRWTAFSTIWWLFGEWKYFGTPPALRFIWYLAWRSILQRAYEAHKALVLWRELSRPRLPSSGQSPPWPACTPPGGAASPAFLSARRCLLRSGRPARGRPGRGRGSCARCSHPSRAPLLHAACSLMLQSASSRLGWQREPRRGRCAPSAAPWPCGGSTGATTCWARRCTWSTWSRSVNPWGCCCCWCCCCCRRRRPAAAAGGWRLALLG